MSYITLKRTDNSIKQNSYINVYKTEDLYKINSKLRKILLRVVKKSILGTNFIYYYSNQALFVTTIFNIIIMNLNFLITPKIFYQSRQYSLYFDDNKEQKQENNNNREYSIFRFIILNLTDILFLLVLFLNYKYHQNKINNYMKKYTQYAIEEENEQLKNDFICQISKDNIFSIEIYSKNKKKKKYKINEKHFFEYVINFPNVKFLGYYYYKKVLLQKEKEIINNIINISNEINNKYRKKILNFIVIIVLILIYIPLTKKFSKDEKAIDIINYVGMLFLIIFVDRDNFFKNKSEQIEKISLLNNDYINDGYFIYIDNNIISIFFLKEKYRNKESLEKIKKLNEKLQYDFDIK